ncbi:hypothetical protein [Imbroritus primus]|uniref:hypothetical protein n=1 Tax=Imbroritus primus TaxID=3058603 RepID=UPI003D160857
MHALPWYFGLLLHPATYIVLALLLIVLMRKPIGKVALTMFFICWDGSKRIKRWWRNKFGGGNGTTDAAEQ